MFTLKLIVWIAYKLSGKTKSDFDLLMFHHYFLSRSVLKAAYRAARY